MLTLPANGRCQCGMCRYTVEARPYVAYTCHCAECQKLSSSAFVSCMHVPSESFMMTSGAPTSCKRVADSGHLLETWFCPSCGSTLFAENSSRPRVHTVHIGTLEHPECVEVSAHIWVKRKVPWINLPENHRVFQEAGDWIEEYGDDVSRYKPQE